MPIAKLPEKETKPVETIPQITTPSYQGVEADTRLTDSIALMPFMEGSTWVIKKYYSQILFKNSALQGQSLNTSATLQGYKLIESLEVKVVNPLSSSQDSASKEFTTTGGAIIFPGIIPNKGDVFLADVGDGRIAVFNVTLSENKSIQKETAHYIEYAIIDYANEARLKDLESKTVERYTYMSENFLLGKSPLIVTNEVPVYRELNNQFTTILKQYPKIFRSSEVAALLIPGQTERYYDPFLTNFFLSLFKYDGEVYETNKIKVFNLDDDYTFRSKSIWDAIKEIDYNILNYAFTQYYLVSAKSFSREGWFDGIYFSNVGYVIYPANPILDFDMDKIYPPKSSSSQVILHIDPRTNLPATLSHAVLDSSPDPTAGSIQTPVTFSTLTTEAYEKAVKSISVDDDAIPDIYNVTKDNYYVFSEAFYKFNNGYDGLQMSKLEIMVTQMLRRLPINKNILLRLCNTYHYWGAVERFYYTPILLSLIRYTLRNY